MKKRDICFVLFAFVIGIIPIQAKSVKTGHDGKSWILETSSAIYRIGCSEQGVVGMYYFGNKNQDPIKLQYPLGEEVPVRDGYSITTPMLEVVFEDQVRDIELSFVTSEMCLLDSYETLIIYQKDKYYPLEVITYLRVLPEFDIIEKWMELKNIGENEIFRVENAYSGSFFLPKNAYELIHLSGMGGFEYQPNVTKLTQGVKTIQVKDFRSFGFPFFAIRPEGEQMEQLGDVWFGSLQYSGNWRMDFEKFPRGEVQIVGGINFWDQSLTLKAGDNFLTPKMIIGYTQRGMEGVSQSLSSYTREKILYPSHRSKVRPVLYNSWYATAFNINEKQQLALAKVAKELGVEVFVIDDAWFKGRINEKGGLGDWAVDKNKFPDGLQPMIKKINAMGMDFGIWIEPEMVSPNSDLYRAHPDWVFHFPNRQCHGGRGGQLMLNLAREDVYQYLYESISKLLRENNIKYIKWDMNKALTDPGFPSAPVDEQRSVRIKYMENLYRLFGVLRSEFPDVWFENCASGGGRVDLGMMACSDFSWASDNTDPVDRIFIHYAYLNVFPANSMISWVTYQDLHKQSHSLEFKFDVSMCGVLGVGYDITKWTEEEKDIAREKIACYKTIREIIHNGDLYRLVSPYESNRSVLQFVDKSKSEAVVFVYNLAEYPNNATAETKRPKLVKLRGLLSDSFYRIEGMDVLFKGSELMEIGIAFPINGAFKSGIFKIMKV